MLRHLLTIMLFLLFAFPGNSQDTLAPARLRPSIHQPGIWSVNLSPNYVYHVNGRSVITGGLDVELFLLPRLSMNGTFMLGDDYMHMNPGIIGIFLIKLLLSGGMGIGFGDEYGTDLEGCLASLALMILSFESLSYHMYLTRSSDIAPYFSLMRLKSQDLETGESYAYYCAGIKYQQMLGKRFVLSPYVEYDRSYGKNDSWVITGLRIGYNIFR